MITFENLYNLTNNGHLSTIKFFDSTFADRLSTDLMLLPTLVESFKALPDFSIKFDIFTKQYRQSGRLVYEYNPFHNLVLNESTTLDYKGETFYFKTGDICDFNIDASLIPFDLKHPLEIELQPSYDGSINLIASDNKNQAILVNSRFSVEELDTYRIIDRKGSNDTNIYEEANLLSQVKLYKTSNVISTIEFEGVESGGRLSCGTYTFYVKYLDLDGNETDVIAESGIIPCYVGNIGDPTLLRGGIGKEITDKLIKLKIINIDRSYDYINIYYVVETSDYQESLMQTAYKILDKYPINTNRTELSITISGYETVIATTLDEIIQEYNLIDRQKSIAQVQNRLFQANITQNQKDYLDLEDLALHFYPTISSKQNIGKLNHFYKEDLVNTGVEYYDPKNVHYFLGYWNKEIYRLGIVYIFDENKLSPVFNTHGTAGIGDLDLDTISNITTYTQQLRGGGNNSGARFTLQSIYSATGGTENTIKRNYFTVTDDRDIISNYLNENAAGVVSILHASGPITNDGVKPLALQMSVTVEVLRYLKSIGVKGFFFVRQRRIPNILFQGLTQSYLKNLEVPLIYSADEGSSLGHRIEYIASQERLTKDVFTTGVKIDSKNGDAQRLSYLDGSTVNTLSNQTNAFNKRFRLLDKDTYVESGTIFSPDIALDTERMSDLLVGNTLKCSSATHQYNSPALQAKYDKEWVDSEYVYTSDRHFANDSYTNTTVFPSTLSDLKVVLVEDGHPLKYSGSRRFRGRAGIQEETFRFESTRMTDIENGPEIPDPDYAIRGLFGTYAGLENLSLPSGTFVDVHVPNFSWASISNYFKIRKSSSQQYYAITNRFDINTILADTTVTSKGFWYTALYRGDCFIGNYTQRINRNFQDAELPLNDHILGNTIVDETLTNDTINTTSLWFSKSTQGIPFVEDNYLLVNRLDVNAVQLGHWITFKVCSNHNLAYRTIDKQYSEEYALTGKYRSFYPFKDSLSWAADSKIPESSLINRGYSVTLPAKNYFINPNVPYLKDRFNNRIMFSEIHVNDSFRNGYRLFKGLDYRDYNIGWGSITKILEWRNNLMIIFEHGIGVVPINESLLAASGENSGDVYIRGVGVLPIKPNPISDTFGSQWLDSIVKTSRYVYGVDHMAKKIWRTDGEQIELISDFKIQSFLNENITLSSREKTPTVGIRNIKTHHNAFKEDVMFTYYDVDSVIDEKKWNMCFNEQLSRWITRYDWEPVLSENINNIYFSYDRESPEKLLLLASSYKNSLSAIGIVLRNYEILSPINPSNVDLLSGTDISNTYKTILELKSDILDNYTPKYSLSGFNYAGYDNDLFKLTSRFEAGVELIEIVPKSIPELLLANKYLFSIRVSARLLKNNDVEWDTVYDTVHLRLERYYYLNNSTLLESYDTAYTTRFWKHGQAGIFDYAETVKPTTWYNTTRPFEFEFVMLDQPGLNKILDNLIIIANKVTPESITFTVTTDAYTMLLLPSQILGSVNEYSLDRRGNLITSATPILDLNTITTITDESVVHEQKCLDSRLVGRLLGNIHYKENFWYTDISPIQLLQLQSGLKDKGKQAHLKDKLIKIRVRYNGNDLAVITLLNSIYTQTYS